MYRYVIKRILMMIPVMLGVTFVIFSMMYISEGDPARMILGEGAQEAEVEALREELGLNDPFLTRYVNYIKGIVTEGDLGVSYTTGRSVSEEIFDRWPTTMLLAVLSVLLATAIGVPTGIISATKQYSIFDNLAMVLALVGVSMPNFWQGLVLILVFSVYLGILPPSGFYGPMYWILPAVTIGTSTAATITRMTRSSMLDVIRQDYIRTARAKGLSERVTITRHALKNALIPIITVVGPAVWPWPGRSNFDRVYLLHSRSGQADGRFHQVQKLSGGSGRRAVYCHRLQSDQSAGRYSVCLCRS